MRAPDLRRTLLFVAGADASAHAQALEARPDVLAQDLEDFTPSALKEAARRLSSDLFARARASGSIPAARVDGLGSPGMADLAAVVPAGAAIILLPKAESGAQVAALAREIDHLEAAHGLPPGGIEILPTAETALGVIAAGEMARASPRVRSCVLGAEDLAADLVAERSPGGEELAYARSRFLLECRAAAVEPIDAPYTYADAEGCEHEARRSCRLGYRSKSTVTASHVATIHGILTPGVKEVERARRIVVAFEAARAEGKDRALVEGLWVEPLT